MAIRSKHDEPERLRNAKASLYCLNHQTLERSRYNILIVEQDIVSRLKEQLSPLMDHYIFAYNPGPFNKSWAFNIAASSDLSKKSILCLIDADLLLPSDLLAQGFDAITAGHLAVLPYNEVAYLDHVSTKNAIDNLMRSGSINPSEYSGNLWTTSHGGCIFVDVDLYNAIGGHDERYRGWGFEDADFWDRLSKATNVKSLTTRLLHLNHPDQPRDESTDANCRLYEKLGLRPNSKCKIGDIGLYANEMEPPNVSKERSSMKNRDWQNWHKWGTTIPEGWINEERQKSPQNSIRRKLAEILVHLGDSLLDVGCGPGALWQHMALYSSHFYWVGTDVTANMLEVAHRHFPEIPIFQADAGNLPFRDQSFDVVLLSHLLEHLPMWLMELALLEATRIARKAVVLNFFLPPTIHGEREVARVGDNFLDTRWMVSDIESIISKAGWRLREKITLTDEEGYENEVWTIIQMQEKYEHRMMLHFALTSEELTYPYYLSILSALRTQRVETIMLWCYAEPAGKYYPLIKDRIVLKIVEKPDIPALRDKDAHFQCAHLKDLLEWRSLYEYGGMFFDLDTFSLKDAAELLDDTCEVVAALECEDVDKYEDSCHMGIVMAKQGSPIIKEIWHNAIEATKQPDMIWNATGGRYGRVFKKYRDKVKFTEWGILGGHGDKVVNWWLPDGYVWDKARILHLYGRGLDTEFRKISEDYIKTSQSIYAILVRQTLTEKEWGPYIMDKDKEDIMRVHFPLTGGDLTYAYYLAIMSALKTQHASEFILWCFDEPKSKYWELIRDKVKLGIITKPDFPSLRDKDEQFQAVHFKDYFQACILYEIGGLFMDLDTFCVSDVCDLLTEKYDIVSPLTCELGFQIKNPFNANLTIARKGSDIMQELISEVESVLSKENIEWGENGPCAFSRVFLRHLDKVRALDYGVADGWIGKVYSANGPFDSSEMWQGVKIMHLYGASTPFPLGNITPEYIEEDQHIYATMVKNILTEDEWNPKLYSEIICHDKHYNPLFEYLGTHECRNIMEIGTHCGRNAIAMIRASQAPEEEITYYGFDMFEPLSPEVAAIEFSGMYSTPPSVQEVQSLIESETKAKAILYKGDSKMSLPEIVPSLPVMDIIYADGGHSIPTVQSDWNNVKKLMGIDTVVFFDDYFDELPMIGCKSLKETIANEYDVDVCKETDNYQHSFGRLKTQLMVVKKRPLVGPISTGDGKRFHLLGLPHLPTNKTDALACAYSNKVIKMAKMLKNLGHTVFFYGVEGSDVECDEFIQVSTRDVLRRTYGDYDTTKICFKHAWGDEAFQVFNSNAIREMRKRMSPTDYMLIPWGGDKPIYDELATTDPKDDSKIFMAVEMGIGYEGTFSHLRVFESYAWMHHVIGIQAGLQGHGDCNGEGYDVVIPNYFDPADFDYGEDKDDYFFFLGRIIDRKGILIAMKVCEIIGAKLLVAGQDGGQAINGAQIMDILKASPNVEYVGFADLEKRRQLLKKAKALFVPTIYIGPFEGVSIEAGLSGTPVITTDFGAFTENVVHGVTGYRCRTMDHFVWAAQNIGKINPRDCYDFAIRNFSLDRVSLMYEEYFNMLMDRKKGNGWYEIHNDRTQLDWLKRYYPAKEA